MVLAAYIYQVELQTLAGTPGPLSESRMGHLGLLFEVLEVNPDLHAAIHSSDTIGCWAKLETKFATSLMSGSNADPPPQQQLLISSETCIDLPEGDYDSELSNIAALFDEPGMDKWKKKKKREQTFNDSLSKLERHREGF
ncbi:hypothetical protein PC129_g12781 [Phytophthora cactorum]|uniref:Uncharacterized protein n=1 Tax=Phytophthora cactorum TaxID=29920 RepID=A0A329RYJ9_9STRA|nr:hypothetical protein PC129_g12781 [Phytophthora cactorum]RAW29757.1 hypothetical protein PC110_g13884 [Phytophthora cactorum]